MKTIFEAITAQYIASYWTNLDPINPLMTQELFPNVKQLGLDLKWIKGARGVPVVLKMSAFDTFAIPRQRIGFTEMKASMPYFKESFYVDEELRQQLNLVQAGGNQEMRDTILNRIFDDVTNLIRGAAARREQMRMQALTDGTIALESNGQNVFFDYGVSHRATAPILWNQAEANPLLDILTAKDTIMRDTGEMITRAMCDLKSWLALRNNAGIRASIFGENNTAQRIITDAKLSEFLMAEVGLNVVLNQSIYGDEKNGGGQYMPENTFVMFPSGALGNTYFGTTPAESDLLGGTAANVAIVDTGVAITTAQKVDPVQIETIVSQISLPSMERAQSIYILKTGA